MDKNILIKVIINVLIGIVLWAGIDFVICLVKNKSFIDTFFNIYNIIEMLALFTVAGIAYYISLTKKKK